MEPKNVSNQAKILRQLRKEKNLTPKELGEIFNTSGSNISLFEYDRIPIGELWARRFGEFFKLPWQIFYKRSVKKIETGT